MDPASVASFISLARFAIEQLDRHRNGDLTDQQLDAAWGALQVSRDTTKGIWADAKAAGGYGSGSGD